MSGFHGGHTSGGGGGHISNGGHTEIRNKNSSYNDETLKKFIETNKNPYKEDNYRRGYVSTGANVFSIIVGVFVLIFGLVLGIAMCMHSNITLGVVFMISICGLGLFIVIATIVIKSCERKYSYEQIDTNIDEKVSLEDILNKDKEETYSENSPNTYTGNNETYRKLLAVSSLPNSNRILTIIFRVIGAFLIIVGVLMFFLLAEEKVSATVTSAAWKMERNGSYYEVYDFTYEYGDNTYTGNGDDNPSHDENGEKVFSVNVGEVYYIYVNKINPAHYNFKESSASNTWSIIFWVSGAVLVVLGFILRTKYLIAIRHVGDQNGDGKINEEDVQIYRKKEYKRLEQEMKDSNNK